MPISAGESAELLLWSAENLIPFHRPDGADALQVSLAAEELQLSPQQGRARTETFAQRVTREPKHAKKITIRATMENRPCS